MRSFLILFVFIVACDDASPVHVPENDGVGDFSIHEDAVVYEETSIDTNQPFEISSEEIAPLPGQPGSPCEHASDCDSGQCLENENGKNCSMICTENCPAGYECIQTSGSDSLSFCVSRRLNLCNPCMKNEECNFAQSTNNICLSFGDSGNFCTISCNIISDDGPNGYTCTSVADKKTGKSSNQCIPDSKVCSCSPRAINLAASTSCATTNLLGSCQGARTCTINGLSNCSGAVPEQEMCDNLDNNCDGKTDNLDANQFNTQCTNPNQFGTCVGKFIACQDGKPICDAPSAMPEKCDGIDNNCDGKTDEGLCDDGNGCSTDACNTDGSCKHTPLSGTLCDDGNICTSKAQCMAGTCMGGTVLNCDDNDPCSTDWCDPFTGCNHKPASDAVCTDDGIACTADVCKDGKCTHPDQPDGFVCVTDGNVCTDDVCTAGKCVHTNNVKSCDDGKICTLNDTCKDGTCSFTKPKLCDDKNPCTQDMCDEAKGGCVFTPYAASDVPCADDNNGCTQDVCQGSACTHLPIPGCQ